LRAPAAEDRLAPPRSPGRAPLRDEAARLEVVPMPPEPVVRVVGPGVEHDDRRGELAVDAGVAVVGERQVESAVGRLVGGLDEAELLDRSGEADAERAEREK